MTVKKLLARALVAVAILSLPACARPSAQVSEESGTSTAPGPGAVVTTPSVSPAPAEPVVPESGKTLVVYFSCTNNTKAVAEKLARATGGDLFEIIPEAPYTAADLNYNTDCRANAEQNDDSARPGIASDCVVSQWDSYNVVFLGLPHLVGHPAQNHEHLLRSIRLEW